MQCKRCDEPAEEGKSMCRPHLDEACAKAKTYAAKKRAAQGVIPRRGGGATAVVKAALKIAIARPVKPRGEVGEALSALDEVIAAKLADVQILERAKEILSRG